MPNPTLYEEFLSAGYSRLPGLRQLEYPAAPLAGAAFTRAVDGLGLRRLLSLIATFTTSATVANRFLQLNATDNDNNIIFQAAFLVAVTASLTVQVSAYTGVTPQTTLVNNTALLSVPPFFLSVGEKLQLTAGGLQAGDAFTAIRAIWEVVPLGVGGIDVEATA